MQISEAVSIQLIRVGNNLLNSKAEFNRCAVPRLALKLGSRNVIENKEKEDEEDEQEKTILEKIKNMGRLAGKRRNEGGRPNANPAPKRSKVDETNKYAEESTARFETITPNMGEKRKIQNVEIVDKIEEKKKHKAKRREKGFQQDIRLFTMIRTVDQDNDMQNN